MLRSLYTAATGMDAQQTRLDVIANNLANAATTGFKSSRADFEDLLSETIRSSTAPTPQGGGRPEALQVGLGVQTATTTRSFSQGDLTQTQNPFDLAIQGTGFFRIQRSNGDFAYTRAGNFRTDATGRIVTQTGEIVEPGLTVPPDATSVTVRADGTVLVSEPSRTTPMELGNLQLAIFTNPGGLDALGNNLFGASAASGEPLLVKPGDQGSGSVSQGYLENANVQAVQEMVNMITTQRAYEMNSKVIEAADQMLQKLSQLR
jgi:flagellar basal-body rod protein FlgG